MNQPSSKESESPRVGLVLVLVVSGMVGLSILKSTSVSEQQRKSPGHERGDLLLSDEDLPEELGSWKKSAPLSVVPPEQLPDWQYWWTQSWQYQTSGVTALVALDQADWVYWHELSVCYESNGWKLKSREVMREPAASEWPFVVAEISNPDGRQAIIAYSMFTGEGGPAAPPEIFVPEGERDQGLAARMSGRFNHQQNVLPERLLQCQAYFPFHNTMTDHMRNEAVALHLQSRDRFLKLWCQHSDDRQNQTTASSDL